MRHDGLIPKFCRVVSRGVAKCRGCEEVRVCDVIELDADYCENGIAQCEALCADCSKAR
jgi:hypothetical protein